MLDVVDWVAEKDQDIEASLRIRSHSWSTHLYLAAESGRIAVIKRLIDLGADIKLWNHFGKKAEDVVKPTVPEYVKEMLKTAEPESEVVVSKTCVSSSQPSLEVNEKPERSSLSILWEKVERPTIQFRSLTQSSFLSPSRAMRSKKQSSRFQVTPVVESETASFSGQFHSIEITIGLL